MKYLLLDVSGTILYKPVLFDKIVQVLASYGYVVEKQKVQYNHKILSETIKFPDRTDVVFYNMFNTELLYSIGIIPDDSLLNSLFSACSYLPWEKYEDTSFLNKLDIPIGILSNFNSSLEEKLNYFFGPIFSNIFTSEIVGVSKPSQLFFEHALEKLTIDAKDILYIGDSFKLDYKPAIELGISTFVIDRDGFYPKSEVIINSLFEIENILKK